MRLLWLPDVLRRAGLKVDTYPGWESRGAEDWGPIRGVVCHGTGGSRTSTDTGETRVLWETGSPTAPAPISQLYLSRSGRWIVGASGRCNHVRIGEMGPHKGYGNSSLIGVEAQNDNRGEPWPGVQVDSYQRGVAAICAHLGLPASTVVGHREHQDEKPDPHGLNMTAFRRRVAELIEGANMPTVKEIWMSDNIVPAPDGYPPEAVRENPYWAPGNILRGAHYWARKGALEVAALRAVVEQLAATIAKGGGSVDTAAVLAGVDAALRDALADLAEGAAARVRGGGE